MVFCNSRFVSSICSFKRAWLFVFLSIVGTIIKLLTGYDIFKNSGVDKYQKAMAGSEKSLAKGAKSAKEINKQLAGFDEMNVLSDNSSNGGGDSSGGASGFLPDLKLKEIKLPKWMEDLLKHGEELLAIILGIVTALKLLDLGINPQKAIGLGLYAFVLSQALFFCDTPHLTTSDKKLGIDSSQNRKQ